MKVHYITTTLLVLVLVAVYANQSEMNEIKKIVELIAEKDDEKEKTMLCSTIGDLFVLANGAKIDTEEFTGRTGRVRIKFEGRKAGEVFDGEIFDGVCRIGEQTFVLFSTTPTWRLTQPPVDSVGQPWSGAQIKTEFLWPRIYIGSFAKDGELVEVYIDKEYKLILHGSETREEIDILPLAVE